MKSKLLLSAIAICLAFNLQAQKYMTRNGHISFRSETPVEDIEAHNHQVTSVLDTQSGEFVFVVLMKSFQFEKALMQEHFNEKYIESDKYPKSTFRGVIVNLLEVDFGKDGEYPATVIGELEIHGETRQITAEGTITVSDDQIVVICDFDAVVADYKIKIPGVVRENIAESVRVTVEMEYEPYTQ